MNIEKSVIYICLISIFIFIHSTTAPAGVSPNVPINHWSYEALNRLISAGLVDSSLTGTKPFSRLEMGRLIAEANIKAQKRHQESPIQALLARLTNEFQEELPVTNVQVSKSFFKPIMDPYLRYIYANKYFELENRFGETFSEHSNSRLGLSCELRLWNHIGLYIHPELRYQNTYIKDAEDSYEKGQNEEIKMIEAYIKINILNLEIQAGRDAQWWGPGLHGALLLSNNSEPFDMIKISNPKPILLPWLFRYLGPFKFTTFLTELEEKRAVPEPKLFGLRLNFKPHPILEIGLSRTIMFGGKSRDEDFDLEDYWNIFWGSKENEPGRLDNNQLGGVDCVLRIPNVDNLVPITHSITFYCEIAGEDEAGGLPSRKGYLCGIYMEDLFLTGRTDLRIEYAYNHIHEHPNYWYNHHIYTSGYTYKGKIIGHHMGSDAEDFFLRITHYLMDHLQIGINYNRMRRGLSYEAKETRYSGEFDFTSSALSHLLLKAGYRFEHINFESGDTQDNQILQIELIYDF